jgi:histidine triad (HIT) family protein
VPKTHIDNLASVDDLEIIKEIFAVIKVVAKDLDLKDFRVINNNGKYQDSKHLHFHLISE